MNYSYIQSFSPQFVCVTYNPTLQKTYSTKGCTIIGSTLHDWGNGGVGENGFRLDEGSNKIKCVR